MKKYIAECIGTAVLTLLGCGTAVFLGCGTPAGVVGTAIAFGLAVVAMAYTIGGISGCHIKDACGYWVGQFIGGIVGAAILAWICSVSNFEMGGANGLAGVNGPWAGVLVEVVATFIFVMVVLGTTDEKKGAGNLAGLAIGLSLILIHLVCINLTGTSVPRSLSAVRLSRMSGSSSAPRSWVAPSRHSYGAALAANARRARSSICISLIMSRSQEGRLFSSLPLEI